MAMLTRLVCRNCLASVESSIGDDSRGLSICPHCSNPLDNAIRMDPSSDETGEVSSNSRVWVSPDAPTPSPRNRLPADRIGRFQLKEWIGGGGYGDVFLAYDPRLDREVALKVLKLTKLDQKATERFLREARAAARLNHSHIVALHDAGTDDGRLWIAYQLVRGQTLSKLRDSQTLTQRQIVTIVRDLALALEHAHRRGVTHRDIKPANVIVDDDLHAYLTDFGLARRIDMDSELTGEGTVVGTPAYMSPEQAAGRASLADGRTDIYSLGIVLYELLCGHRPTDLPSNTPLWQLKPKELPPNPRSLDQRIPQTLDFICMKALSLNPEDRHADGRSMACELDAWLHMPVHSAPASAHASDESQPVGRLKKRLLSLGAVGVLGLIGAGILQFAPGTRDHSPTVTNAADSLIDHPDSRKTPSNLLPTDLESKPTEVSKPSQSPVHEISDPDTSPVIVNKNSHMIHLLTCTAIGQMKGSGVEYANIKAAEDAGHTKRCTKCINKKPH